MGDTQRPTLVLKTGAGEIDLLNPTPEQVNIDDMLHNLSRIPRWCGAGRLSVLQHMMHVALILQKTPDVSKVTTLAGRDETNVTCKTCRRILAGLGRGTR